MISYVSIQFSNEEKAKFKVAFEMFDANNDGTIDISELNDVMKSLGDSFLIQVPIWGEMKSKKI